jgi:hypothetical protein
LNADSSAPTTAATIANIAATFAQDGGDVTGESPRQTGYHDPGPMRSRSLIFAGKTAKFATTGGGAGVQLRNAPRVVRDVAIATGALDAAAPFELLTGDPNDLEEPVAPRGRFQRAFGSNPLSTSTGGRRSCVACSHP